MRALQENTDYKVYIDSIKEITQLALRNTIEAPLLDSNTRELIGQDFLLKIGKTRYRSNSIEVGYSPKGRGRRDAEQIEVTISDLNNGFDRLVKEGILISRYGDSWRITIVNNPDYYMNDDE